MGQDTVTKDAISTHSLGKLNYVPGLQVERMQSLNIGWNIMIRSSRQKSHEVHQLETVLAAESKLNSTKLN